MARKLRVQYPDAIYNVMNLGDRREPIFKDDQDRQRFLETFREDGLASACVLSDAQSLSHGDRNAPSQPGSRDEVVAGTFASRFNRRHKLSGHLFSGRYKSLVGDGSGDGYLRMVCDYVHLNPVRA